MVPSEPSTPPQVTLNALDREDPELLAALVEGAARVIRSGWFVGGPEVEQFCGDFAAYCGVRHCVGVGNGTDALEIALRACGVVAGDEVIMVANAGMYAASAARIIGAVPVYVDIDPDTHLMDGSLLEAAFSHSVRAVVATHLYGAMVDMRAILDFAHQHDIAVIEDCAQAHGATQHGRLSGSFGDAGAFSFYPTKNLGALGDGGAVVSNSDDIASRAQGFAQYGWMAERYRSVLPNARNSRLDAIQAAFLQLKLRTLDAMNERRCAVHRQYSQALAEVDGVWMVHDGDEGVHHLAVVEADDRERLHQYLAERGIQTAIHYPIPDHLQPSLAGAFRLAAPLPVTERAASRILTIPCHPALTEAEVLRVCTALSEFSS